MSQGSFLESLKTYLQRLTSPSPPKRDLEQTLGEPAWARSLLLRILERVEHGETGKQYHARQATEYLAEWQAGDRIVVFVRELTRLLKQGLAASETTEQIKALVELGLARWFDLPGELPSRIKTAELDRRVEEAKNLAWSTAAVFVGLEVVRYAASNQLTIRKEGRVQVSPLGEVFLQLQGRDSVRWLLQVEAHQALGPFDQDRLSREAASAMLSLQSWPDELEDVFPCASVTASRLEEVGILRTEELDNGGPSATIWSVSPLGREMLSELVKLSKTPLALLVETLCSDLTTTIVQGASAQISVGLSSAAEATASQARMVVHEVRNALLPVQAALSALYKEILVLPVNEAVSRRRPMIDSGITDALKFTDSLLKTAELRTKPPERFDPIQAISEAAADVASISRVAITVPNLEPPPLLLGRRENFVLIVRNLLRNAIQHGGTNLNRIAVEMAIDKAGEAMSLAIDDDGQGVLEADRDRIFQEGVSSRPGGTGIGLSWVKQVVERELHGVIACTHSPLGGARFAIRIPIPPSSRFSGSKESSQ